MTERNQNLPSDLIRVVQWASAFSLGTLAALLYSVKALSPRIQVQFTWATLAAFAVAALASAAFWQVVFSLNGEARGGAGQKGRKIWLGILATGLALGLVFAFIYPLKDLSREKSSEIGFGACIAIGFLTALALLFWRVVRYLESDHTD